MLSLTKHRDRGFYCFRNIHLDLTLVLTNSLCQIGNQIIGIFNTYAKAYE